MANKIQIKRSVSNSTVTGLSNGELAFTQAGNILYIGAPDGSSGSLRIGGLQNPGTLTANQALVANSTSGIDKVITGNLVTQQIYANGSHGTGSQVLVTGGSSSNVYWAPVSAVGGVNTDSQYTFTNNITFNASVLANTVNATSFTTSGVTTNTSGVYTTGIVNGATISVGTSFIANTTSVTIANTVGLSANGSLGTAGQILASNGSTVYWINQSAADVTAVTAGDGLTGGGSSGELTLNVGAGNGISVSADAVAVLANSGLVANTTGLHILTSGDTTLIANATGLYVNDATLSIATSQLSGDVALGTQTSGNYVATITAGVGISGSSSTEGGTPTIAVVANNGIVANSTGVFAAGANGISVTASGINVLAGTNGGLVSNTTGVFVTAGSGLVTNATGVHVGTGNGVVVEADSIRVQQANGIIVNTGGVSIDAAGGLVANATGLHVGSGNGIAVDADSVRVVAGTGVVSNATGVHIGQAVGTTSNVTFANVVTGNLSVTGVVTSNVIPSANLTYHLGNTTNRWAQVHGGNGHFVTGTFDSDVQIAGNLTVTGNVTTTNINDLIIGDPLIHLAANNETSDVVDIGFIGHYSDDGGSTKKHIGFFRDASDGGVFKLFQGSQDAALDTANSVVVNVNATGYTTAILETYLRSSGLSSNSSVTNITANSTVSVAIVANTLTLSSPLVGTSGGTGKSTMTSEAILVGNTSNGYKELTLGTSGYVLQSNGTALVYDVLDGGTF